MSEAHRPTPAQELDDLIGVLACDPAFRVAHVPRTPLLIPLVACAVSAFKAVRSLRFVVEFAGSLTLLSYRIRTDAPSGILVDLLWHAGQLPPDWWVYIHFLDREGTIRLQGDYALPPGSGTRLKLLPNQRRIEVPADLSGQAYRIRLGVWSPAEGRHLPLTKFRGCIRDTSEGFGSAVILDSFKV